MCYASDPYNRLAGQVLCLHLLNIALIFIDDGKYSSE
jgi:hypothetical protein